MMKVTYPGPLASVDIADGQAVAAGSAVEVDDALGVQLIDQGWSLAKTPKAKPAATTPKEG